jgi:hypothetical protein
MGVFSNEEPGCLAGPAPRAAPAQRDNSLGAPTLICHQYAPFLSVIDAHQ